MTVAELLAVAGDGEDGGMTPGKYRTKYGSTVEITNHGRVSIQFDWFSEPLACFDCVVDTEPRDGVLRWDCYECGGGNAELELEASS